MLGLKLHFLINLEFFTVWDRSISHEFVLPSEIDIMLVQFAIVVPQKTFNFVSAELSLMSIDILCILRWGLFQSHWCFKFVIKVYCSASWGFRFISGHQSLWTSIPHILVLNHKSESFRLLYPMFSIFNRQLLFDVVISYLKRY